jgi:hypothetical protein
MSKTDEEIFKEFLEEYKIKDPIDKEYYRNSVVFASYLLRYRGYEFAKTLEEELSPVIKALDKVAKLLDKR